MKLRVLDLFSGIGGFSLGLERATCEGEYDGFETVAFCEIENFPRRVLAKHWPAVPCYSDVRNLTAECLSADGIERIDVITGGFPCQDISTAGKQAGLGEGTRSGLWSEIVRLSGELRPRFIIVENVAALLSGPSSQPGGWFGRILGDLAECGYDAEWENIPAAALGAPHRRERVWLVAHANENGSWEKRTFAPHDGDGQVANDAGPFFGAAGISTHAAIFTRLHGIWKRGLPTIFDRNFDRTCWSGQQWPEAEPVICRMDDGVPDRVGRTSGCGNAVIPQIPELIGNAILESLSHDPQ